jgi:alkylation response protein AidB-like acyl-CoA dehydrogenase
MAEKFLSEKNLRFLLYDMLELEALCQYPYFEEHSRETFDMVLDTAVRMGKEILFPIFTEMDREPPRLEDGTIKVHPKIREYLRESGEGGWISAAAPFELDGQQLPMALVQASLFVFGAANFSAGAFPFLTAGAAELIESFGDEHLKEIYIPKMFSGEWQGTMALTEPQAGSSLTDITTTGEPTDDGYYLLRGQKIFISAGDHDAVDNVVHLLLGRIKGAPPGVKGISLFLVPRLRIEGDSLVPNDVTLAGTFHKMGYKGCPITQLSLGENNDCRGWLVGEPHQGLRYMFQMMNAARLGVGMQATSIASAAYYASMEYAQQRPQGRKIDSKDPNQPQISIIEHADIRRLLLFQRGVVEGSLSLNLWCLKLVDLLRVTEGEEREKYSLLLDIMTPVAKTFPSEMGILSVSAGLQILGGYGYCDEFPLEQYYRDMRIHPIHEGTTGIQAMDLLGRKVVMKNGRALELYLEELEDAAKRADAIEDLAPYGNRLREAVERLKTVTAKQVEAAIRGEIELFLADASLYLEMFGYVTVAWQWLLQGLTATAKLAQATGEADKNFYQGKIMTMKYFFHYELPRMEGPAHRLLEADGLTVAMKPALFED